MFKKSSILLLILSFFSVLGFGCKGLTVEQQVATKPVTLNYWTVFDDTSVLQQFATQYSAIRPYVKINIRKVRYEEFDKLFVNALADDVAPDLISIQPRNLKKYINRLAPMPSSVQVTNIYTTGDYFKETVVETQNIGLPTSRYVESQYVGVVAKDVLFKDQIYGLPLAVDTMAIYYNKDLLDKAGVAQPPTTWEEFMQAVTMSSKFNVNGDIIQSGVALGTSNNIPRSFDILSLFIMQSGLDLGDGYSISSGLKEGALEEHPTIKALNFYTDFARPNKEVYSWNEKQENALDSFARGKSVFYFGFAYDFAQIKSRGPQINFDVIAVPQLAPDSPINVADYWIESVVSKSKNQNEAWDFLRFITTPENTKIYAGATGQLSPLRADISTQKENPTLEPFVRYLLQARNWYHGSDYEFAQTAMKDMISSYLLPMEPGKEKTVRASIIGTTASKIQQTL